MGPPPAVEIAVRATGGQTEQENARGGPRGKKKNGCKYPGTSKNIREEEQYTEGVKTETEGVYHN